MIADPSVTDLEFLKKAPRQSSAPRRGPTATSVKIGPAATAVKKAPAASRAKKAPAPKAAKKPPPASKPKKAPAPTPAKMGPPASKPKKAPAAAKRTPAQKITIIPRARRRGPPTARPRFSAWEAAAGDAPAGGAAYADAVPVEEAVGNLFLS